MVDVGSLVTVGMAGRGMCGWGGGRVVVRDGRLCVVGWWWEAVLEMSGGGLW